MMLIPDRVSVRLNLGVPVYCFSSLRMTLLNKTNACFLPFVFSSLLLCPSKVTHFAYIILLRCHKLRT